MLAESQLNIKYTVFLLTKNQFLLTKLHKNNNIFEINYKTISICINRNSIYVYGNTHKYLKNGIEL